MVSTSSTNEGQPTNDLTELLTRAQEISSDAEVVTRAHLRKVTLAARNGQPAGVMGLITLDNGEDHTRPNTFGPRSLISLNTAIDAALADDEITSLGVTGKPFILAAGADLTSLAGGADGVHVIARLGHAVFRKLQDGGKPSFGFVNGLALGGGLEVALHCTYRTVMDSAPALGLPEVMLGLVPGWGGAYLVPNLVGPPRPSADRREPAQQRQDPRRPGGVRLRSRRRLLLGRGLPRAVAALGGRRADRSGQRGPPGDRPGRSLGRGGRVRRAGRRGQDRGCEPRREAGGRADRGREDGEPRRGLRRRGRGARGAVADAGADRVAVRVRPGAEAGQAPGRRARQGAGASGDQGRHRRRRPDGRPLALLFVRRLEVPVVLTDLDQERVDKGVGYVHAEIDKLLGKGRISQDKANRFKGLVSGAADDAAKAAALSDADFVIEAVFEEMSVKKSVFADVEKAVSPECILATNTSSLSISEMAADLAHPERVVGFHFFNPVAVMPCWRSSRASGPTTPRWPRRSPPAGR